MRRIIIFILLPALLLLIISACYDAEEVTDVGYVTFVGIDRGINDKWRLTFIFPSVSEEEGGSSQAGSNSDSEYTTSYKSLTLDAPSFFGGVDLANAIIPRKLNFMHTQIIVFSEELARDGLIGEFIAPIIRYREIRHSVNTLISLGKAEDFVMKFRPFIGSEMPRAVDDFYKKSRNIGLYADFTLYDLYDAMKSTYHQPVVILGAVSKEDNFIEQGNKWGDEYRITGDYYAGEIPRKKGAGIELMGLAIMDGDKMVEKLTGHESRMLAIAKGGIGNINLTIPDPKRPELIIPVEIRQLEPPKIKVSFDGDKPIINLKIELEGDILAIQSQIDYESLELQSILESAVEEYIKDGLSKTIEKTQRVNCDVFEFGYKAVQKYKTIQEWEALHWNSLYKDADITTEVNFTLRRTGSKLEDSPIIYSEEN